MSPHISRMFKNQELPWMLALAGLTLAALILRLHAISPYLLYPDAYQALLVAQNLSHSFATTAPMGEGGLVFPQYPEWTRPGYSALIALAHAMDLSWTAAAHAVALLAGVAAVPAAYFMAHTIWRDRPAALAAAALTTISYNHTVWGGLALSEPMGVLTVLIALAFTWRWRSTHTTRRNFALIAIWLAIILTRYEYALLLLPALGAYYSGKLNTLLRKFTRTESSTGPKFRKLVVPVLAAGAWLTTLALIFLPHPVLAGIKTFATGDLLIVAAALLGITVAALKARHAGLRSQTKPPPAAPFLFAASGAALLAAAYLKTNPAMSRYGTHLIPFLLIPASYGAAWLLRRAATGRRLKRAVLVTVIAAAVIIQAATAYIGLRSESANPWFSPGYEAIAAQAAARQLPPGSLLITSLPEPYYFFTGYPTQTIADDPPYLFAGIPDSQTVVIIQDEPMRQLYPQFSALLDAKFQSYKTATLSIKEPFRYRTEVTWHPGPVSLYTLKAGLLRLELLSENR